MKTTHKNWTKNLTAALILAATLSLAFLAAACGGGSGGISATPAPTPTAGPYSATTLNGSYAFQMHGQDSAGPFARIGSFTANGSGAIIGGAEDVNSQTLGVPAVFAFSSGAYSINANGKGTLTLTNSTGTLGFSVVMTSPTGGLISQTDGTATAVGDFTSQDTTTFANIPSHIAGSYVFDFTGLSPAGLAESQIGQFNANGAGGISTGIVDINNGAVPSGVLPITGAAFTADAVNGPTTGRGTATMTAGGSTFGLAFYIVSANRIRFLRADLPALAYGDAVAQTGTIPTTSAGLSGSFAFVLSGASISGNDVRAGRLSLSGGTIDTSSLELDDDSSSASGSGNSNPTMIPHGTLSAATYTIDATNVGTGRGTLTFSDSSAGTFAFIFYLSSPTQEVLQDNSPGIVADGPMSAQGAGPFSAANQAGNWAFTWQGQSVNGTTGGFGEEDFLGQYTLNSSGAISGGVDFTEISASSVVNNAAMTGMQTLAGDGTHRNTFSVTLQASPSATLNFSAYLIDANTMFVVGTDTHRVITGTVVRNF